MSRLAQGGAAAWGAAMLSVAGAAPVQAQNLEPRLYFPAPTGINVLVATYSHASGSVLVDAALPVTDFRSTTNTAFLSYARSFGVAGRSAQFQAIAPFAVVDARAIVAGQDTSRHITGPADPLLRLAVNLKGAPARTRREFATARFGTLLGASLSVGLPLGQFDPARYLNIGANRWSVRPEVALVQPLARAWAVEAYAGVTFFTDNTEFLQTSTVRQAPLFAGQAHLIRLLGRRGWLALDATMYSGGETTVDGVTQSNFQSNLRLGATGVYTFPGGHGIRAAFSSGFYTRFGGDFDVVSVGYSYAWGG